MGPGQLLPQRLDLLVLLSSLLRLGEATSNLLILLLEFGHELRFLLQDLGGLPDVVMAGVVLVGQLLQLGAAKEKLV